METLQNIYEKEIEEAICKLNIDYKNILTSKEYILGRKIYKFFYMVKNKRFKECIDLVKKYFVIKKEKQLNINGDKWLTWNGDIDSTQNVVIYTCLVGGYGALAEPLYKPKNIEYIAFTDFELSDRSLWKRVDINSIKQTSNLDNQRKNRYIKTHPHVLFPGYSYSIYIDANIRIIGNLSKYLCAIGNIVPIAVNWHPVRYCVYSEAKACCMERRDDPELIHRQVDFYRTSGFPKGFGLIEGGMLVREHNNKKCIKVMETWWEELCNWSKRDQISFPYVLWKNGFDMNDIGFISKNIRGIDEIIVLPHGGLKIG